MLILCYHNLVPDSEPVDTLEAELAVPASQFARQVRYLAARYAVSSFDDVDRGDGGRPSLILTFDDGYRAIRDRALPVLRELGLPAYVFVNTAFVGGWNPRDQLKGLMLYGSDQAVGAVEEFLGARASTGSRSARAARFIELRTAMWRAVARRGAASVGEIDALFRRFADERVLGGLEDSRLLSWDDLAALREQGIRVGNHTHRHLELDTVPLDVVRFEIREGHRLLQQHLGADEPVISYPRGKVNAAVAAEAAAAGYRWGLTSVPGRLDGVGPTLTAPRVLVSPRGGLPQLLWKASRLRSWARRVRRGPEAQPAVS